MNCALKQNLYHSCHSNSTHASKDYFSNSCTHSNFPNGRLALRHAPSSHDLSCLDFITDLPPRSKPRPALVQLFSNSNPCISSYPTCETTNVFPPDPTIDCGTFASHKLLACENREGSSHLNAQQCEKKFDSEDVRKCE
jgi:hypothetical protein